MKEAGKGNIRDKFIQTIKKDPHLVALIMGIKFHGIGEITQLGTLIILYNNKKTGITAILDPAKPTIFIEDKQNKEKFNISIGLAINLTLETFGYPEFIEIPKIQTNLIETPEP
ncbi:MAG: hypothetical protein ACO2PP_14885 [Thermocrinis sp.]|jgi:hypothetical protein|uniref:hypothetical protein n=1 Tax=Thermocrinis sp. TaxID=2024383 RepID=UPI003C090E5C